MSIIITFEISRFVCLDNAIECNMTINSEKIMVFCKKKKNNHSSNHHSAVSCMPYGKYRMYLVYGIKQFGPKTV